MAYKHGALGEIVSSSGKSAVLTAAAPLYVGTAPVHTVAGGNANLNKPVLLNSFAEAAALFGFSEDWAKYTLCEAMYAHFKLKAIGPILMVNVLDVDEAKSAEATTASLTPSGGRIVIENAESILLDSVAVTGKVLGTDYTIAYDYSTLKLTLTEKTTGALGTEAVDVSYNTVDATGVTSVDVIGASDGEGINTGLYSIKDVYQECGILPNALLAPGFSDTKTVHDAMAELTQMVSGHWDLLFYTDLPLSSEGSAVSMSGASTWKATNGYTANNEKTHYPMWAGGDGRKYHLSVLDALNRQALLAERNNLPYESSSNTELPVAGKLYFGEDVGGSPDDETVNTLLTANGICSAVFIGGRWVLWGAHTASYTQATANAQNISETNLAMLHYISNDFQVRRANEVDKPLTRNRMQQIVAEETARLDAMIAAGALIYGKVTLKVDSEAVTDMQSGDFTFLFEVTTTPLSKSLTALVSYTGDGLTTYFEEVA